MVGMQGSLPHAYACIHIKVLFKTSFACNFDNTNKMEAVVNCAHPTALACRSSQIGIRKLAVSSRAR